MFFCYGQSSSSSSSVLSGGEDGLDGKDIPQKGDTKCPSLADRFNYFATHKNDTQQDAADIWLLPCEEDNNNGDGSSSFFGGIDNDDSMLLPTELPSHAITLSMYAALPAFASDFRTLFSWGVVGFLDEISLEYDVMSNFSIPLNFTERRKNPKNIDAQIIYQYVISNNIKEHEASWWYQYQFIFYCFYGNAHGNRQGKPILNTDIDIHQTNNHTLKLKKVEQRLNHYLRYGIDIINVFHVRSLSYGILGISMEDPTYSTTPFIDGPPTLSPTFAPSLSSYDTDTGPSSNNGTNNNNNDDDENAGEEDDNDNDDMLPPSETLPNDGTQNHSNYGNDPFNNNNNGDGGTSSEFITYTSPVNVQLWDWRRFLGLFLFIGTLIGTMVLTQLASYRRRQRMKQTIWGNIGTEQGVEALLSTGWKFKDSTLMEVYNKAGMGYRDDDSMLLGGYEQTHTTTTAVGGGETSSGDEGVGNVSSLLQPETLYGGGIGGEITFTQDGSLSTPEYPSDGNS